MPATKTQRNVIPNQVFIGCRWTPERKKYIDIVDRMALSFPISFIIIGKERSPQEAIELLDLIKEKLASSSYAIFDATGGNANVSLEYGYAEGSSIPNAIYLSEHEASKRGGQNSIISDLAGKKRNVYKNVKSLATLLRNFASDHPYVKEFEKCMKTGLKNKKKKGEKKKFRTLCLKIVHFLNEKDEVRRSDLVQSLLDLYKEKEIDDMIALLHKNKLIVSSAGRFSTISLPSYS